MRPAPLVAPATPHTVHVSRYRLGHLDPHCAALHARERFTSDTAADITTGDRLAELFDPRGKGLHAILTCRICALEPVLREVLATTPARDAGNAFVITGLQQHGARLGSRRLTSESTASDEHDVTPALERLAQAAGLTVVSTQHGAVMYGYLPVETSYHLAAVIGADVLIRIPPTLPDPQMVATYWTLRSTTSINEFDLWPATVALWDA